MPRSRPPYPPEFRRQSIELARNGRSISELGGETEKIRAIPTRSRGSYGTPRIHAELQEEGLLVGCKRVARLMWGEGLQGVSRRKAPATTIRRDKDRRAPDLVERNFTVHAPNGLWVAEITYIATAVVSISPLCSTP